MAFSGPSVIGARTAGVVLPRLRQDAVAAQVATLVGLGLIGALLRSMIKLRLGIPGHAALLWLVPILAGRCVAPIAAAGSIATSSLALGLLAFGGLGARWPVAASFGSFWLVGPALDLLARSLNHDGARAPFAGPWAWLLLPVAGLLGNMAHFAFKVAFGAMRAHAGAWGLPGGLFELASYTVFGLAAGAIAYAILRPLRRLAR